MKFTFPPESKPLDGYTIKRAIHRGGFGEVYYALSDAGKEVALKLLQNNLEVELRGVSQCMNLKHPNLVTIFDIRTDADGDHWIVMEYISGAGLNQVIDQLDGPMPMEQVQQWLSGIAAGLAFLHDSGIVHRDLKPANIYMENGTVKVGDVGLAKFISESRRSAQTQSVGTVYYMAPEVAHGRYGREVDIYSLGIVLYELITGRVPFDGESTAEILMKHLSEKPDLSPIPERLRPVLAAALAKDPEQRTSSVSQLAKDFTDALNGFEISIEIPSDSFVDPNNSHSSDGAALDDTGRTSAPQEPHQTGAPEPNQYAAERNHRHSGRDAYKFANRRTRHARKLAKLRARAGQAFHSHERDNSLGATVESAQRNRSRRHSHRRDFPPRNNFWLTAGLIGLPVLILFAPAMSRAIFPRLFVVGAIGALIYGFYRLFDAAFRGFTDDESPAESSVDLNTAAYRETGTPSSHESTAAARSRKSQQQKARDIRHRSLAHSLSPETQRSISLRHRMTELTGSLTLAVLVTAVITAGLSFILWTAPPAEAIAFFGLTTLLASWAILTVSKFSEGTGADGSTRRMIMLAAGCVVGALASFTDGKLLVDIPPSGTDFSQMNATQYFVIREHDGKRLAEGVPVSTPTVTWSDNAVLTRIGRHPLRTPAGQPTMAGYLLFFVGLFGIRRWWWQADAFRKNRFRIRSFLLSVFIGWMMAVLGSFPVSWGVMLAAAISCVVQVSSTWMSPDRRIQLMEAHSDGR